MVVQICSAKVKKSDEGMDIIFNYLCSPLLKTPMRGTTRQG